MTKRKKTKLRENLIKYCKRVFTRNSICCNKHSKRWTTPTSAWNLSDYGSPPNCYVSVATPPTCKQTIPAPNSTPTKHTASISTTWLSHLHPTAPTTLSTSNFYACFLPPTRRTFCKKCRAALTLSASAHQWSALCLQPRLGYNCPQNERENARRYCEFV